MTEITPEEQRGMDAIGVTSADFPTTFYKLGILTGTVFGLIRNTVMLTRMHEFTQWVKYRPDVILASLQNQITEEKLIKVLLKLFDLGLLVFAHSNENEKELYFTVNEDKLDELLYDNYKKKRDSYDTSTDE